MSGPRTAVLGDELKARLGGRRLVSAVFLTFQFDPGFFEQEILTAFFELPLSSNAGVRLLQLEEALRSVMGEIAVYYDHGGLVLGDNGPSKLDVRRIPVRQKTGIFHPKNLLALVENVEPDDSGRRERALIVGCMSANLTRSGWWENVEAAHFEEILPSQPSRITRDLAKFLSFLQRRLPGYSHGAIDDILGFLRGGDRLARRGHGGWLHTHFYDGRSSLPDFLENIARQRLTGLNLEIISPYFDDSARCAPLEELQRRFAPRETRVHLPRGADEAALVPKRLYERVRSLDQTKWGSLERDLLKRGESKDAAQRFVHAKVYRFFSRKPKRELLFVGSPNLTTPAHGNGGNLETGFLVEINPQGPLDFWLTTDDKTPRGFEVRSENEGVSAVRPTRLRLRYDWKLGRAEAIWDAETPSPSLRLEGPDCSIGEIPPLVPQSTWSPLPSEVAAALRGSLRRSSIVYLHGEHEQPSVLLVEETGMEAKPSIRHSLTVSQILEYWARLTPDARAEFLEEHMRELGLLALAADSSGHRPPLRSVDSSFDRFAGFFSAFASFEKTVCNAIEDGRDKEAVSRLLGDKYDSLGRLLERLMQTEAPSAETPQALLDPVERYVIVLSAQQLIDEVRKRHPDFWQEHRDLARGIEDRISRALHVREELTCSADSDFLAWYERWFLRRATPVEIPA